MQTHRITGNHTVLHSNAIMKLYYILQLDIILISTNMANMKKEDTMYYH
jgi:hypothetical protein